MIPRTGTATLPANYLASPDHEVRFAERSRDTRRARPRTGVMRLFETVFLGSFVAVGLFLLWRAVTVHPMIAMLPTLMAAAWAFAFVRSRGNGIVVDDRGIHIAMGDRTGGGLLPAADIVHTEVFSGWNPDWARSIRMIRYVRGDRSGPAVGVEVHTPAGPQRALVAVSDPYELVSAVDRARRAGVTPWLELADVTTPSSDTGDLDVAVSRDGDALSVEAHGPHVERRAQIVPHLVTGYRISRDPAYLSELRARRDDTLSRFGGGAANRRNRQNRDVWRMQFCGARRAQGAVEVIMDGADGLPVSAVVSTDHPERVALLIDEHVRAVRSGVGT